MEIVPRVLDGKKYSHVSISIMNLQLSTHTLLCIEMSVHYLLCTECS